MQHLLQVSDEESGTGSAKKPETHGGFQQSIFEGQIRKGCLRVCDQFMKKSLINSRQNNRVVLPGLTLSILQCQ